MFAQKINQVYAGIVMRLIELIQTDKVQIIESLERGSYGDA